MSTKAQEKRLQRAIAHAAHILYPKGEQDGAAVSLCQAFGSPSLALEAAEAEMIRACDLPGPLAFAYSMVPEVARYIMTERAQQAQVVTNIRAACEHLLPLYLGTHYECGHMLCLTEEGRFISCVPLRMGSIDEAPFYTRIIIEAALSSGGDCFILAHNHPGGTRLASADDCASTLNAMEAMSQLDMALIDHIIIADGEAVSIREVGSISARIWNRISPLPKAFQGWPG